VEDFISCGLEALIRSIDRYDPEKGGTLEQFAWIRIHGAVLDELRRNDWAPRSLRRWEHDVNRAREQFVALYGLEQGFLALDPAVVATARRRLTKRYREVAGNRTLRARRDQRLLDALHVHERAASVAAVGSLQRDERVDTVGPDELPIAQRNQRRGACHR
jgi:hypothetical protein